MFRLRLLPKGSNKVIIYHETDDQEEMQAVVANLPKCIQLSCNIQVWEV